MATLSGKTHNMQCQHCSHTRDVLTVESNYDITNIHRGDFEKLFALEVIGAFLIKAHHRNTNTKVDFNNPFGENGLITTNGNNFGIEFKSM